MTLLPRSTLLILVAAVAIQAPATGQSVRAQAASTGDQQPGHAQPATRRPTTSSTRADESVLYRYLTLRRYPFFIEYVGRENYLIQKQIQDRAPQQPVNRTDYASAIGISDGEGHAMLEIVLNFSPQIIENWDQIDAATLKFMQDHGSGEKLDDDPELKDLYQKQMTLTKELRTNLQSELEEEFITKLDAYVYREFIDRTGPASLPRYGLIYSKDNGALPGSSVGISASEQAQPEKSKPADELLFDLFFQVIGTNNQAGRQGTAGNDVFLEKTLPSDFTEDKRQAAIDIVISAFNQLRDNDRWGYAACGQYHRQYGPQPIPINPLPSELVSLYAKHFSIVEKHIANLRQAFGEEDFKKLDESVQQVYGERETISAGSDSSDPPN